MTLRLNILFPKTTALLRSLGVPTRPSDLRVARLRNAHRHETCFVLGSGPSLSFSDMDLLVGKHVIAVNKIYLAYPHTRMRPSYYVVADKRIACEVAPYLNSIACPKFIEYWAADSWCKDDSVIVLRRHPDATLPFSRNLLSGTVGGATVLFTALQIAYYLGFDRVVLLGLDFAYTGMERTGQVSAAGEVMVTSSAANYFIKEYSPVGRVTSAPRLSEQRAAFAAAHAAFSASGRTLVNASRQTALDSIPRARLEEYI